jgi:virginiamycin A acetyltransferase
MPSAVLIRMYGNRRRFVRQLAVKLATAREGGEFRSTTLREIFRTYHRVDIGMYTHGGCFVPFAFGRNTTIGRYCSIARSAFAATANHPMERKSTHGYFHSPSLGYADALVEYTDLAIGNDVWMGHNSVVMPSVATIGDGAVIGAGAVVFKDVPAYAVVVGNPARVVRYRFAPETIAALLEEKWWDKDIEQLAPEMASFAGPVEDGGEPRAYGSPMA